MSKRLELASLTEDFDCPFCGAPKCCVAEAMNGPNKGEKCVLHPDPGCESYLRLEPWQFLKAANDKLELSCKCKKLETLHVAPGWGCCKCRVYNDESRAACKHCGHEPKPHPYGNGSN